MHKVGVWAKPVPMQLSNVIVHFK